MQAVTISIRPARVVETLAWVDALMPFITEAVVICPPDQLALVSYHGRLRVTAVDENVVLGGDRSRFRATTDHQLKNLLLRLGIATSDLVDEEFVMLDDDSRPLAPIAREELVESGRHHGYTFYDLGRWQPAATDFDRGQQATGAFLRARGLSTLSFASHMPQAIHKRVLAEAIAAVDEDIARGLALDEWSLYFNWGRHHHPELFHSPRSFVTLCWPALPTDWPWDRVPPAFRFENFYPELYRPGRLFGDLPTAFNPDRWEEHTAAKVARRSAVQRAFDAPTAGLQRRLCWQLHRLAVRLAPMRGPLPKALRRRLRNAAEHGHDPAFWRSYDGWPQR